MPDPSQPLRRADVDPDPLRQFGVWYDEAESTGMSQPEAAAVATATPDGAPSARIVLVKHFDAHGFVFFSNYESRKGNELAANPRAALLFHWPPLGRQVRIEGPVERTSLEESSAYARGRPRASQLSALASQQSRPVERRDALEQRVAELAAIHAGGEVPLPDAWGGYRLSPVGYEFWQHREDRLHDRLRYARAAGGRWEIERLAP